MKATLGDVCQFLNGGTPSKDVAHYFEGDIPWITSADIVSPVAESARSFITEEAIKKSATNMVKAGTVLLVTRTGVGKVAITGTDLCFSQDITALIPDPAKLYAGYLVQYLQTKKTHFERHARGATIKGITRDVVADLSIPLPPLPEQIRIAAILDQADALRVKRKETLAHLDSLTQAIFIEMFGDPDSNPKNWIVKKLGEFCSFVNGGTPSKEVSDYFNGEIPWISSADIADSKIQNLRHFITKMGVENSSTNLVPSDTILLVTRTGVGKVVITNMDLCFSQDITAIIPNINIINKIYLTFYLKIKESYFKSMARGATIKGITRNVIESLKVPLPPLELQNNFAVRIQAIEMIRESQKKSEFEFDSLFTSLQHCAFRGEL